MMSHMQDRPDLTVLIATYNRCSDLRELLRSVLEQQTAGRFGFEVVVVNNNSSDATEATVGELAQESGGRLRHRFERRQGKSFALNTGLEVARGTYGVIVDDDQLMPPGYLADLMEAFRSNPDVAFIGGKVLPVWEEEPPGWLTKKHWSPLGMLDHGDEPFYVDESRRVCLLTFAFRMEVVRALGGFRTELGVTGNVVGSTEDADLVERLWRGGRRGLYLPSLVLRHSAPARRMSQEYHLYWHRGHGMYSARCRNPHVERSVEALFDVPAHMYRQALLDLAVWTWCATRGDSDAAFTRRTELAFFRGFFGERYQDFRRDARHGLAREFVRFLGAMVREVTRRGAAAHEPSVR